MAAKDYFEEMGHRRLALDLLADAVFTIAKKPDSEDAIEQEIWLKGNCKSACPAAVCLDIVRQFVPVPHDLYETTIRDPQGTAKLMRYAVNNFDRLFERATVDDRFSAEHSVDRVEEYRSVARAH